METFYAKLSCGCCTAEMRFENEASISEAFKKAGLQAYVDIADDAGVTHAEVDTFYGWSKNDQEQGGKSLGYLISLLS